MTRATAPVPQLTRDGVVRALKRLGLEAGQIVFVHSSLSSIGYVEGGADAVVDGLLDVLGSEGTLAVPAFTPRHRYNSPVFDPANDYSEVGKITETLRTRPGAFRSRNMRESMAALGPAAKEMMRVHRAAAWGADGPFWKLYELDARIMLIGVPYFRSTFWHLIEQWVQPAYGRWNDLVGRIREADGTEGPLRFRGFGPNSASGGRQPDFNKLGARLEARGLVSAGALGNAMVRLFRARDAFDVGVAEFRNDPLLLVKTGGKTTPLRDGVIVGEHGNEKSVVDPDLMFRR